ncbi:MAG: type II secretion system protein [Chthoniobacteraceae bacterium]
MRKSPASAFTLLEMLTVLAIIVILSGIVLGVAGYAQKKAALSRANGEIAMIASACESYKSDNGSYPRDIPTSGTSVTDIISPKKDFVPTDTKYNDSSLFLYKELTGDKVNNTSGASTPDGITDDGAQRYMREFDPRILNTKKDPSTKVILQVNYLQDPFGFPYAYSTAAAAAEQKWQRDRMLGSTKTRPTGDALPGFNLGSFDLWSTGGSTPKSSNGSVEWPKWTKNW